MNYLAHLFLSFRDPDIMTGNFIADNIALSEIDTLTQTIQKGILLHRKIDAYTDRHHAFLKATQSLRDKHGKYAPVIVDIWNDHLLCHFWHHYSNESIEQFENYSYHVLHQNVGILRGSAKKHVQNLITHKYLKVYQTKDGLVDVMNRMDKRTRFPSQFELSVIHLYEDFDKYADLFRMLFSDIVKELPKMYEQVESIGD